MRRPITTAASLLLLSVPSARADLRQTVALEVREYLERTLSTSSADQVEIGEISVPELLRLPEGPRTLKLLGTPGSHGRCAVRVTVAGRHAIVGAEVRVSSPVVVTRRALRRGEPLTVGTLSVEMRDVTSIRKDPVRGLDELEGEIDVVRPLREDEVLTWAHIERRPLVRRGDTVRLLVRMGTMEAWTDGVANADAGQGERIDVVNKNSRRMVEGRVRSAGVVEVVVR